MATNRSRKQVRESRALGLALTPKAVRYFEKRPYGPGEHGRTRRRQDSDYAVRLKEKQRLRAQYGIRESQLRRAFEEARRTAGLTGENLVELLVDRPSFRVKPGQTLQVKPKSQTTVPFEIAAEGIHRDVLPAVPEYLDVELSRLKATLVRRPKRAEVPVTVDVQMVVEHYSR